MGMEKSRSNMKRTSDVLVYQDNHIFVVLLYLFFTLLFIMYGMVGWLT